MKPAKWKLLSLTLVAIICVTTGGCSTRIADLTIACTSNVNLDHIDLDSLPQRRDVIGRDSIPIFLFIPFGTPNLEEAIDNTLREGDGNVLLDAVVYSKGWWFIFGQATIEVRGNVVNTRGAK